MRVQKQKSNGHLCLIGVLLRRKRDVDGFTERKRDVDGFTESSISHIIYRHCSQGEIHAVE
jgi:endonuclease V-like protein UPF0215 family